MSLVAYLASSDEESESEDDISSTSNIIINKPQNFSLPPPKYSETIIENSSPKITDVLSNLPAPKVNNLSNMSDEEEDEFLKKKAVCIVPKPQKKGPVRISIPSLSNFKDDDKLASADAGSCFPLKRTEKGLLALLPRPKSETIFQSSKDTEQFRRSNPFIPHSLTNKNKTNLNKDMPKNTKKTQKDKVNIITNYSDSDDESETEGKIDIDFFSFNSVNNLPEISENEINAMVAKKAEKIKNAASKFDEVIPEPEVKDEEIIFPTKTSNTSELDNQALQVLCGSSVKRKKHEEVNFVNLSHEQVMPSKNDWMRSALTASTEYQPRGNLADDDLTPGSKRKHQITYLAQKAKANEQELQAMWSQNRQSRRQTQSKYGF